MYQGKLSLDVDIGGRRKQKGQDSFSQLNESGTAVLVFQIVQIFVSTDGYHARHADHLVKLSYSPLISDLAKSRAITQLVE